MADAAWSPDDSTFRSPYWPLNERSLAGQNTRLPGVKGIYALSPRFVPWIWAQPSRGFRSLVNLWASISQPRLRYTLGSAATDREDSSQKGTVPAPPPGAQ
jgi:hypothetical protein